jgi:hypothetical protein
VKQLRLIIIPLLSSVFFMSAAGAAPGGFVKSKPCVGSKASCGAVEEDENSTRAQDYNSSRSNRRGDEKLGKAQDHNTTRSNRHTMKGGGGTGGLMLRKNNSKAQDYNSSRSNRRGVKFGGDNKPLRKKPGKAQDHNTTRSNRHTKKVRGGNIGGPGSEQGK